MACKVDANLAKLWLHSPSEDVEKRLHMEHLRFAVQKDEFVMNVSHKMFRNKDTQA